MESSKIFRPSSVSKLTKESRSNSAIVFLSTLTVEVNSLVKDGTGNAGNMKKYARNVLYDKLHRGSVLVCVGLTLYGTVLLGDHFYKYFKYVRPQIQASKEAAEKELLSEGSSERLNM
ncbi:hypothetical protein SFRURICE_004035 [Spodoptera frugiperda]|uniref:SFRICE_003148 n=1 Tax=Spodoptera frugiperda TaxID=7108 RepID=A0A2H1W287_SPOFR|nr:hypothetical protein SFRURICE_004035 [Spodoptera frugiperda]